MLGSTSRRLWAVGLFSLAFTGAAVARADDPRDVRIRAALASATHVDFKEAPMTDALRYLSDFHDIPIELDTAALKKARIDAELPLTAKVKNAPLEFALWKTLAPHGVSFMIKDHVLTVTTQEAAGQWQKQFYKRFR